MPQRGMLDREVLDMKGDNGEGPVSPKLFTYMRYNAELTSQGLEALGLPNIEPRNVQRMDSIKHIPELQEVGRAVANEINMAHFAGFLQ